MSDEPREPAADAPDARRRDHLSVVDDPAPQLGPGGAPPRPRTIGRVIAQTALIADSAITRRRAEPAGEARGVGRLLGRFR